MIALGVCVLLVILLVSVVPVMALAAATCNTEQPGPTGNTRAGTIYGSGTHDGVELRWPCSQTIAPRAVVEAKAAVGRVKFTRPFGAPTDDEVEALEREGASTGLTTAQLLSVRRVMIGNAAARRGAAAARTAKAIAAEWARGEPAAAIARRLDLPPTAVLRIALTADHYSKNRIKSFYARPREINDERIRREVEDVSEADYGSRHHQMRGCELATEFERRLEAYLRNAGAAFTTERDARHASGDADRCGSSAPAATPDVLLERPIRIAVGDAPARVVNWLDAKNYIAMDDPVKYQGLRAQALKYTKRFGPGALVFADGVMAGGKLAAVQRECGELLILDGGCLPA